MDGALSYCRIAGTTADEARHVVDALATAHVATVPWESNGSHRAPDVALVLVNRTEPDALGQIAFIARACPGRVLAVWLDHTSEPAWQECHALLAAGATDVVTWTPDDAASGVVSSVLDRWALIDDILRSDLVVRNLIGQSAAWRQVLRHVIEAARYSQVPVLITGETGTGKELIARLIHTLDTARKSADLIVVDCTTLSPELAGSELFGHERGAFTGALEARQGAFARADGGTVFLDEVGDLPIALQGQLLRAIQERVYKRVGGNTWLTSNFRLICATNRDLNEDVSRGRFRSDLYHRIAGVTCRTPALRERVEDIPALANHFLAQALNTDTAPPFSRAVYEYLVARDYPGNIRDLRLLVHVMARRYLGAGPLTIGAIPHDSREPDGVEALQTWLDDRFEQTIRRALMLGASLREIGRAAEDVAVRVVLAEAGSTVEAARRLGISPRAVQARRSSIRDHATGADAPSCEEPA